MSTLKHSLKSIIKPTLCRFQHCEHVQHVGSMTQDVVFKNNKNTHIHLYTTKHNWTGMLISFRFQG